MLGGKDFQGWRTVTVLALLVVLAAGSVQMGAFFWLNELDALYRANPGALAPGRFLAPLAQPDRLGMLLLPLGGLMVDRFGPRRVLLIAIPLGGLGVLLAGTVPSAAALAVLLTVGAFRVLGVWLPTATVVVMLDG